MSDNKNAAAFLELEQLQEEITGFHALISGYMQMVNNEGISIYHPAAEIFINTETRRIAEQLSGIREKIRQAI